MNLKNSKHLHPYPLPIPPPLLSSGAKTLHSSPSSYSQLFILCCLLGTILTSSAAPIDPISLIAYKGGSIMSEDFLSISTTELFSSPINSTRSVTFKKKSSIHGKLINNNTNYGNFDILQTFPFPKTPEIDTVQFTKAFGSSVITGIINHFTFFWQPVSNGGRSLNMDPDNGGTILLPIQIPDSDPKDTFCEDVVQHLGSPQMYYVICHQNKIDATSQKNMTSFYVSVFNSDTKTLKTQSISSSGLVIDYLALGRVVPILEDYYLILYNQGFSCPYEGSVYKPNSLALSFKILSSDGSLVTTQPNTINFTSSEENISYQQIQDIFYFEPLKKIIISTTFTTKNLPGYVSGFSACDTTSPSGTSPCKIFVSFPDSNFYLGLFNSDQIVAINFSNSHPSEIIHPGGRIHRYTLTRDLKVIGNHPQYRTDVYQFPKYQVRWYESSARHGVVHLINDKDASDKYVILCDDSINSSVNMLAESLKQSWDGTPKISFSVVPIYGYFYKLNSHSGFQKISSKLSAFWTMDVLESIKKKHVIPDRVTPINISATPRYGISKFNGFNFTILEQGEISNVTVDGSGFSNFQSEIFEGESLKFQLKNSDIFSGNNLDFEINIEKNSGEENIVIDNFSELIFNSYYSNNNTKIKNNEIEILYLDSSKNALFNLTVQNKIVIGDCQTQNFTSKLETVVCQVREEVHFPGSFGIQAGDIGASSGKFWGIYQNPKDLETSVCFIDMKSGEVAVPALTKDTHTFIQVSKPRLEEGYAYVYAIFEKTPHLIYLYSYNFETAVLRLIKIEDTNGGVYGGNFCPTKMEVSPTQNSIYSTLSQCGGSNDTVLYQSFSTGGDPSIAISENYQYVFKADSEVKDYCHLGDRLLILEGDKTTGKNRVYIIQAGEQNEGKYHLPLEAYGLQNVTQISCIRDSQYAVIQFSGTQNGGNFNLALINLGERFSPQKSIVKIISVNGKKSVQGFKFGDKVIFGLKSGNTSSKFEDDKKKNIGNFEENSDSDESSNWFKYKIDGISVNFSPSAKPPKTQKNVKSSRFQTTPASKTVNYNITITSSNSNPPKSQIIKSKFRVIPIDLSVSMESTGKDGNIDKSDPGFDLYDLELQNHFQGHILYANLYSQSEIKDINIQQRLSLISDTQAPQNQKNQQGMIATSQYDQLLSFGDSSSRWYVALTINP